MAKKKKFRFYLKLSALIIVLLLVATVSWFILRIEKIVLSRLPREVSTEGISISFLDRSFHLKNILLRGRIGSPCEGRDLVRARELKGSFHLRERVLTKLTAKDVVYVGDTFQKECFVAPQEKDAIDWRKIAPESGLAVDLQSVRFNVRRWGEAVLSSQFVLREKSPGRLAVDFKSAVLQFSLGEARVKKLTADLERKNNNWQIENMEAALEVKLPELQKIAGISSPKLTILRGAADATLNAAVQKGRWQIDANVRLIGMRLRGAPLYRAPFQFMEMTPQAIWPMVEDSPGVFQIAFKSKMATHQLVNVLRRDFRAAVSRKVKWNLKKKIKILPF